MAYGLFRFMAALGRNMIVTDTFGSFALLVVMVLGRFIISRVGDDQTTTNWKGFFSISSYSPYFNVDTDVVVDRIISSVYPMNDFFIKIDGNPDLVGSTNKETVTKSNNLILAGKSKPEHWPALDLRPLPLPLDLDGEATAARSRYGSISKASMATVDETLALVGSTATVEETLALVGCSISAIDEPIADSSAPGSREEALQRKLQKLLAQSSPIIHHEKNLTKAVNLLEIEFRNIRVEMLQLQRISLLPDALIHFVHLLEVADQYFDFKKIAKQAFDFKWPLTYAVVFETLLADQQQLKSKFNKIGESETSQVANAIQRELCDEHHGRDNAFSMLTDWVYKLVFQARERGYVMDQEPIAELEKMIKFEPHVFDEYFLINPLQVKCTEKSTEEARNKYSQLVSKMHSEYKDAVEERRRFDEKPTFVATATASRLKRKFVETDGISEIGKNRGALRENGMRAAPNNFGGWA